MPGYFVYLLRCADETLYCGITTDIERRLAEHNSGKGARYTRARLPVHLASSTPAADRSMALKVEAATKKLSRAEKLHLIEQWSIEP